MFRLISLRIIFVIGVSCIAVLSSKEDLTIYLLSSLETF